jgi:hypothetical protein
LTWNLQSFRFLNIWGLAKSFGFIGFLVFSEAAKSRLLALICGNLLGGENSHPQNGYTE